jgi:hypothetical protein
MKKIFVSLALMVTVALTTTVFAKDKLDVNDRVKESFQKEFTGATLVKWQKVQNLQEATFVFYNHAVIAYFNDEGELLGSAREVLFYQLPLAVIKSFDKMFSGTDVVEVLEISNTDGTFYRVTTETQTKRYQVRINANGNVISVVKVKGKVFI